MEVSSYEMMLLQIAQNKKTIKTSVLLNGTDWCDENLKLGFSDCLISKSAICLQTNRTATLNRKKSAESVQQQIPPFGESKHVSVYNSQLRRQTHTRLLSCCWLKPGCGVLCCFGVCAGEQCVYGAADGGERLAMQQCTALALHFSFQEMIFWPSVGDSAQMGRRMDTLGSCSTPSGHCWCVWS